MSQETLSSRYTSYTCSIFSALQDRTPLLTYSHALCCGLYTVLGTALNELKVKVKVWTLAIAPFTWVRLVTSSALQSWKWQLISMSNWCRSALCGHPLSVLTDNWTHCAASRHTIGAPISHTRPSPHSHSYYSFLVPLRVEGRVGLSTQQVSNLLKVASSGPGVSWTCNLSDMSPIPYHYTTAPTCV